MSFLVADLPYFKAQVRREFTRDMVDRQGEYLDAVVFGVTAIPGRCLGFQVAFREPVGGAMWARLPIHAICFKPCDPWPVERCQLWDCPSSTIAVHGYDFLQGMALNAVIDGAMQPGRYIATVDYTGSDLADDPEQHKQAHLVALESGHLVGLPNNRLQLVDPAFWAAFEQRPDFIRNTRVWSGEGKSR